MTLPLGGMKPRHLRILAQTSRTFLSPIAKAPGRLKDAVGSAYLCMRAIDEIEDHAALEAADKVRLLNGIADVLEAAAEEKGSPDGLKPILESARGVLPEVSLCLSELAMIAEPGVRPLIWRCTADMARAMAGWVRRKWHIRDEADLDQYTYDVAGRVGLLLSRLWLWFDGTVCDDKLSVGFGRALQAVNIVRNSDEDRHRGVDFYPEGWDRAAMIAYARRQIGLADVYMDQLPAGPVRDFCRTPLELAKATLKAIESGQEKLSRKEVLGIMTELAAVKGR